MVKTLTAERLKQLLHYDPVTGVFTRLVGRGRGGAKGVVAGHVTPKGYRVISLDCKSYMAHVLAWLYVHGEFPTTLLDHKDNIGDHNWIDNLRPANKSKNAANASAHKDNTSGHKGVSWSKVSRRWRASIGVGGKQLHLGLFDSKEEAATAYTAAAKQHFKEFARD